MLAHAPAGTRLEIAERVGFPVCGPGVSDQPGHRVAKVEAAGHAADQACVQVHCDLARQLGATDHDGGRADGGDEFLAAVVLAARAQDRGYHREGDQDHPQCDADRGQPVDPGAVEPHQDQPTKAVRPGPGRGRTRRRCCALGNRRQP